MNSDDYDKRKIKFGLKFTMDPHPTRSELRLAIADIECRGDYTHRQICSFISEQYPDCVLSIKVRMTENNNQYILIHGQRMKRMRAQVRSEAAARACIAVRISDDMTVSTSVTQGLVLLLANLLPVRQARPTSNLQGLQIIERLLPDGEPQAPLVLFPKEQKVTHWYYHIYFTTRDDDKRSLHPVLREIFGRKCPKGEVVIVKNGEGFVPDSPAFDLDCDELGKTLWWYIRSGRDPIQEASERRLMHYIEQL